LLLAALGQLVDLGFPVRQLGLGDLELGDLPVASERQFVDDLHDLLRSHGLLLFPAVD